MILLELPHDQYWDDVSIGDYAPNQHHFLDKILSEGEFSGTACGEILTQELDQPQLLSELAIIGSKLGGIAFRVLWTKKPNSSASPPSCSSSIKDWNHRENKIETATKNKQNAFRAIRQRCQERHQRAMVVRARKAMPHIRPLAHGYSLLAELPYTSEIFIRPPTQGGVAFDVLNLSDVEEDHCGTSEVCALQTVDCCRSF